MSAFRERVRDAQRACDVILGHRNAHLRFDMRLADTIDASGCGNPDTWRVWIESQDGTVLASGEGHNGVAALDVVIQKLKEKTT